MLKPGMFISDRYEIIDKVGSGGMADVYKARCHRLNRFVAIKVLKQEYSDDKNFVNKFRGEAQSAAGLSHPNIVNVYDVGDDNGLHYIVMELVEGITLKNFIERKGKLEVKEAVGIAIQIAMGMEAAHLNHIIHRDIKPQNIIISREGKVKVTDFGIAKATNSNTITSNAMGSVHYLSPEQARGGYSDEKSDIYSLGVTLYEMLSGQVPFAGDNTVSVALLHIQGEPTPLRELDPNIPISVERIVQKCMQKKPERRYLTASDLIADLKRSITNPNGDFVVIPAATVSDSPTITISDAEVNHINKVTRVNSDGYVSQREPYPTTEGQGRKMNSDVKKTTAEEEEELDSVDPRVEKIAIVGTVAAGIIILCLIIYAVTKFFNLLPGKGESNITPTAAATMDTEETTTEESLEPVEVPKVIGLEIKDAQEILAGKSENFNITFSEEPSDTFEAGLVIDQYPDPGSEVDPYSEIKLVLSSGPEKFEIPDVYNLKDSQAVTKLEDAGLVVKHDYGPSDDIEEGRVISTNPEKGSMVVKGDTVTVLVSDGPEITEVAVPDLRGLTESKAKKELEKNGLVLGNVSSDYSDKYANGKVMNQNYDPGAKIKKGTAVDITVSLGLEDEDEPVVSDEYRAQVVISENPFEYEGERGNVWVELEQDGVKKTVRQEIKTYADFPWPITIKSDSESNGIVTVFVAKEVNGVISDTYEESASYGVVFQPVE